MMKIEPKSIGDLCPKCGKELVRKDGMFYWRGTSSPGMVCKTCRSLWAIRGEMMRPLRELTEGEAALWPNVEPHGTPDFRLMYREYWLKMTIERLMKDAEIRRCEIECAPIIVRSEDK